MLTNSMERRACYTRRHVTRLRDGRVKSNALHALLIGQSEADSTKTARCPVTSRPDSANWRQVLTPQMDARLSKLLRAALSGDEAAYAGFLREIAGLVRAVVGKRIGPSSGLDPEDIVQETLLAIHLKRHTWRTDGPVGPWVHAIARYKMVDAFRRNGRAVSLDIDDFSNELASEEQRTLSERDLERALECLTSGQRQVVSSISLEGRSISETASRLGMKETAVRVALHRGLAAIAQRFGDGD